MTTPAAAPPETPPEPPPADAQRLAHRRAELECEKIGAELAELRRPWWQRPAYLGILTPIVLAILTVASAWATGFFDTRRAQLENRKQTLETQNQALEGETRRLQQSIRDAQAHLDATYASAKRAVGEASYSLAHVKGIDTDLAGLSRIRREVMDQMNPDERARIARASQFGSEKAELVGMAEKSLKSTEAELEKIPVSDHLRGVTYLPGNGLTLRTGEQYKPPTTSPAPR